MLLAALWVLLVWFLPLVVWAPSYGDIHKSHPEVMVHLMFDYGVKNSSCKYYLWCCVLS